RSYDGDDRLRGSRPRCRVVASDRGHLSDEGRLIRALGPSALGFGLWAGPWADLGLRLWLWAWGRLGPSALGSGPWAWDGWRRLSRPGDGSLSRSARSAARPRWSWRA